MDQMAGTGGPAHGTVGMDAAGSFVMEGVCFMMVSYTEVFLHGWPIYTVLLVMSILSVTVILERFTIFGKATMDEKAFMSRLLQILEETGPLDALEHCKRSLKPIACVAARVIGRAGDRAAMTAVAEKALQEQIDDLERRLPILATVASSAPFVGLFGTVTGIIWAFHDIGAMSGAGPEVVASGISEALYTTAFGLLVALPASILYNYFISRLQRLTTRIDLAVFDLVEELARRQEGDR